jgi:hypothetical protein
MLYGIIYFMDFVSNIMLKIVVENKTRFWGPILFWKCVIFIIIIIIFNQMMNKTCEINVPKWLIPLLESYRIVIQVSLALRD